MKIWIHVNGVQQGPYSKEQVEAMHLPASTPVWYEGLAQWMPACQAPELADLFGAAAETGSGAYGGRSTEVSYGTSPATAVATEEIPERPANFLAWSIILTLCCCTPFSFAAVICGAITNMRYGRGDYAGAERMSRATEWLVIIAITLGIVSLPLSMAMMF